MSVDIVTENAKAGTYTFNQMLPGTQQGDISVAGFARKPSYNVGDTAQFCITGAPSSVKIFRVGWYGGMGFRQVATVTNTTATQPDGTAITNGQGAYSSTAWSVTASWAIPSDAVSGMYLAMVRNAADNDAFYITFVVRDDAATADIIYKTSETTWGAAYNHYGTLSTPNGKNLYGSGTGVGNIMDRATVVSYHRPVITRGSVMQTFWWACELPLIRFLERNGYSIKYITGVDLDKNGVSMLSGKGSIFLSSGHDEYWSQNMRDAVEAWRDVSGGNSIFMSGNEILWRTRFVYNGDETQMWCYKDTMPGPSGVTRNAGDPYDPVTWTGTWKDTRWPNCHPEWLLTGTSFGMNGIYDYDAVVPKNPYGGFKTWGNTALIDNDITLTRVIGFEADHKHPTQPNGSYSILAAYTRSADGGLSDPNGQNYNVVGNIEWGIVAQRYSSGAMTVGFGTCQWSWTLDDQHDRVLPNGTSIDAQKFTINLLHDMGANPQTLMAGVTLQAKTSLDEYGAIPSGGVTPPPPLGNNTLYQFDDTALSPFMLVGGSLVQMETHS